MARKTPPVSVQVVDAYRPSNARFKKRLIDFDTGSAELEEQHKKWLSDSMNEAKKNSGFHIWMFGFASHLGNANFNRALSLRRMNSVLSFLQAIDNRTLQSIDGMWHAAGEDESGGDDSDNSAEWRAVEIHLFIGAIPPPPPPNPGPPVPPPPRPPLPGGERFRDWEVASPGGVVVTPFIVGPSAGFNVFMIRNIKRDELRGYVSPVLGGGASPSIPGLGLAARIVQSILTSTQFTNMSFTKVTPPPHPTTWEEVEGCLVSVRSAGGGIIKGKTIAHVNFHSSGVYQYGPSGVPLRIAEDLWDFDASGDDWQLGVGGTAVAGPLIKVG
jgi:hypothetical protein